MWGPVKSDSPTNPGAMGFDEWLSHDNFFELNPILSSNGAPPNRIDGEGSSVVVDAAINFIADAQATEQPFFVVVWFGSPHEPYSGLEEDLALYDNLPDQYAEKIVTLTSNHTGLQIRRPLREVLRERYAEITAMDRAIGQLRDYLEHTGLKNNTMLWYKGDNGTPSSGLADSPLRGLKGTMYEEGFPAYPASLNGPHGFNCPEQLMSRQLRVIFSRHSPLSQDTTSQTEFLMESILSH
ncbi:MAG: hypothetical protein CM1200mP25_4060 [Acidobacteriota bacterium]|nr:MAG: hypothetical protein CM1200mP25_4060 [Acidobacteriota bacterium]